MERISKRFWLTEAMAAPSSCAAILMGHSAGAHLAALLSAESKLARAQGALP